MIKSLDAPHTKFEAHMAQYVPLVQVSRFSSRSPLVPNCSQPFDCWINLDRPLSYYTWSIRALETYPINCRPRSPPLSLSLPSLRSSLQTRSRGPRGGNTGDHEGEGRISDKLSSTIFTFLRPISCFVCVHGWVCRFLCAPCVFSI